MKSAVLAASVAMLCATTYADPAIVTLKSGQIKGSVSDKNRQFLGVPFAHPPVDNLRWQPPQAVQPWSGVRDAQWFGNSCVQGFNAFDIGTKISEDCLYLNVFTPVNSTGKSLPVMIFFYGGSWESGAAGIIYDGAKIMDDVEDVILVTPNYRLGEFGYLASPAMRAEDPHNTTGNYGLQDQRFAMQWVHENIAAFGGNPDEITIFGESAGAGSVSCHLVAPRSAGLFKRAMMESGPFAAWTAAPLSVAETKYNIVAQNAGCAGKADVLGCLRSKNTSEIVKASHGFPNSLLTWAPVIDGVEFADHPQALAKAGKFSNKVPVLLGTNMNEGTLFDHISKNANETELRDWMTAHFGANLTDIVMKVYPVSNYQNAWWTLAAIVGDAQMTCPARRSARWLTDLAGVPVHLYYFKHVLEVIDLFVPNKGCCHGSELAFVFDIEVALWTDKERELSRTFVDYWTNFAHTGNPNGGSSPNWPVYSTASDATQVLDIPISSSSHIKKDLCDFWDTVTVPGEAIWG